MVNESKARLDEMQKKLRGLDALEKRVRRSRSSWRHRRREEAGREEAAAASKPATPKKPPA